MSGTDAYDGVDGLPPLVVAAVDHARSIGFGQSCRPEQGRLLQLLAAGRAGGVIGETGTGCGVGLGWLASGADRSTRIVSVERDAARAREAAAVFGGLDHVTVLHGGWRSILEHGPFDLLVLDGGGSGKGTEPPVDVTEALTIGGTVVIDDFTPSTTWPPTFFGAVDHARLQWLDHPALLATEVVLARDLATIVATRMRR